jgi:hypothetical protein
MGYVEITPEKSLSWRPWPDRETWTLNRRADHPEWERAGWGGSWDREN